MTDAPREIGEASGDRDPVEVLADEFARRLRDGEHPSVHEYAEQYPDLADSIRVLFPTIAMMERAGERTDPSGGASRPPTDGFQLDREVVGDFRILREIGRGGMGVVYEAQQQSLNRRVALKVLCPAVSRSPRQLRRFRREAEAAARLHHTNIVPVFGVGEDAGLHFYAMQLIDGVSFGDILDVLLTSGEGDWPIAEAPGGDGEAGSAGFTVTEAASALLRRTARSRVRARGVSSDSASADCFVTRGLGVGPGEGGPDAPDASPRRVPAGELLRDLPEYWRRVAKIGISVARALGYSHEQGILHRDIKPSNVLLDRKGIVWVADFGLAKPADGEGVTNPGDVVGTIRYMAPEQFNGLADARSDIHSLGLMLYELLTLRPAYATARHGHLIRQKMTAPPPPPRSIVPEVPRDLETIVLKACAIAPDHRYPRAEDLEADLKRYLEGRPIRARRVSVAEKLWRWARRNPVTAALSTSTMLLLLTAAVVFAVGKYRTDRALGLLAVEKARVEREKTRVESERAKAVRASDLLAAEKQRVESERAKAVAAGARATREYARAEANLRGAVAAFEQIMRNIASRGVPKSFAPEEGEAARAVTPADVALLETLLAFFDEFADRNVADLQVESARARRRVGDIQKQLGRFGDAEDNYREALDAYCAHAEKSGEAAAYLVERARILADIADLRSRRGNAATAALAYQDARRLLESVGSGAPADVRFELAKTLTLKASIGVPAGVRPKPFTGPSGRLRMRGMARGGRRRLDAGAETLGPWAAQQSGDCEHALEILSDLLAGDPNNPDYRLARARAHRARALLDVRDDDSAAAAQSLQAAVEQLERLTTDLPAAARFRYELADTLRTPIGKDDGAADRVRRAVALSAKLLAGHPEVPEYQALAGDCLSYQAVLQAEAGDLADAAKSYERAIAYQKPVADRFEAAVLPQWAYVQSLTGLVEVHTRRRQMALARSRLNEAIDRLESLPDRSSGVWSGARMLADLKQWRLRLRGPLPIPPAKKNGPQPGR